MGIQLLTIIWKITMATTETIQLNEITVVLTNGKKFKTKSTYNKGKEIALDVDPFNHPAWRKQGGQFVNVKADKVAKFNSKFGNMNFLAANETKAEAKPETSNN